MGQFKQLKEEMDKYEVDREELIRLSRDIVGLSKELIYATHRKDFKTAEKAKSDITKLVKSLKKYENSKHYASGSFKISIQEYVEAVCYLEFVKNGKIQTCKELDVDPEYYLLGLCDLTGELTRNAVNSAINDDYKKALEVQKFVVGLYEELMQFDFGNGELRKKFDGIKWELNKLQDLVFQLKMKGMIR
jgi:predicted translin family RNA/ssDNA-binding protein